MVETDPEMHLVQVDEIAEALRESLAGGGRRVLKDAEALMTLHAAVALVDRPKRARLRLVSSGAEPATPDRRRDPSFPRVSDAARS